MQFLRPSIAHIPQERENERENKTTDREGPLDRASQRANRVIILVTPKRFSRRTLPGLALPL